MTDFDDLIKNKAEQAEYPYKPSVWKKVAAKAGIKTGLSVMQILVVAVSVIMVAGGIKHAVNQPNNMPVPAETILVDTTSIIEEEVAEPVEAAEKPAKSTLKVVKSEPAQTEIQEVSEPAVVETAKPAKKTVNVERGPLRPVRINVDTITQLEATEEQLRNGHSRLF